MIFFLKILLTKSVYLFSYSMHNLDIRMQCLEAKIQRENQNREVKLIGTNRN